ncbi:peroxiredoxin [Flavimobilis soli]|uniref:Peroxiredoxin n=1 Tax=Flavimobilis soli TaxID=442709 RepID=A0A2A9EE63_9MICO|nr:TlpA disulfide reductase family protein [Flavimobilis soli]PFG36510.1 peroxiredoxin [Flavimobilis soli]
MKPRHHAARAAVAVVAAVALLAGCSSTPDDGPVQVADQGYQSGDGSVRTWAAAERGAALELTGTDYDGEPVDVSAWRGDVVVLNTWFAACPPCRVEAPVLADLATSRADDGVHVLGINRTDDAGAAQAFERTYEIPYPSIDDRSGAATSALEGVVPVAATPTTVVLDRQGRVAARVLGLLDATTIAAILDDVLAES